MQLNISGTTVNLTAEGIPPCDIIQPTLIGIPKDASISVCPSFRVADDGTHIRYDLTLRNVGDESVTLDDLAIDVMTWIDPASGNDADPLPRCEDAPDHYLLLSYAGDAGHRLLIMPLDDTQFEWCEPITQGECAGYRCHIASTAVRHAMDREAPTPIRWKHPATSITLRAHRHITLSVLMRPVLGEHEAASFLVRMSETPLGYADGVNGMHSLYHFLLDDPKDIRTSRDLTNGYHAATITEGRLASLSCPSGGIEAIDPDIAFGDVTLVYRDGRTWTTTGRYDRSTPEGDLAFDDGPIAVRLSFRLEGPDLRAGVLLSNHGPTPIVIDDVSMALPLNSRMAWGVDAAKRMIRHTQVAGDNSFMLATPADGAPPYLLCVPGDGVRWELFDLETRTDAQGAKRDVYRVHMHGAATAAEAERHEGGRWRLPVTSLTLAPGEERRYDLAMVWVNGYAQARAGLVKRGKVDVQIVPGCTLPQDAEARIMANSQFGHITLDAEHPDRTSIREISCECRQDGTYRHIWGVRFDRVGEHRLMMRYGDGRVGWIEMFSTLPVARLIEARADYIARWQCTDSRVWYDGLLQERNTKTGAVANPDDYDQIRGWRIYEVTCDDPGLSKPAFLASKNAEHPVEMQVRALDRYLNRFVWGGLQRTNAEEHPYGVFGVPDWDNLRRHRNDNGNEQLHIGRLWDYPHVALTWFMMYRIALREPTWVSLPARTYLLRAWGTFTAMYRYPDEVGYDYTERLDNTSPYRTGYYNELIIADVIDALRAEGETSKAAQLESYWNHKADFLIRQARDLFGSEYAFDTTGFETTQAVVNWGRNHAMRVWNSDPRSMLSYRPGDVERFDRYQRNCNIACRGWLENGFYITGSDIRNDTMQYTLSYMSQMGGWSLMQDALYADGSPFGLLRLASASLLSSWALVNAGDESDGLGYWYPGAENQGASSGGFEPLPYTTTWLGQPADRGYWIYGCETDLGYCGYLRGAALIVADDPDFGRLVYGGRESDPSRPESTPGGTTRVSCFMPTDGVARRLHLIRSETDRVHVLLEHACLDEARVEEFADGAVRIRLLVSDALPGRAELQAFTHAGTPLCVGACRGTRPIAPLHDGTIDIMVPPR